jgi:hypothetical protein
MLLPSATALDAMFLLIVDVPYPTYRYRFNGKLIKENLELAMIVVVVVAIRLLPPRVRLARAW